MQTESLEGCLCGSSPERIVREHRDAYKPSRLSFACVDPNSETIAPERIVPSFV